MIWVCSLYVLTDVCTQRVQQGITSSSQGHSLMRDKSGALYTKPCTAEAWPCTAVARKAHYSTSHWHGAESKKENKGGGEGWRRTRGYLEVESGVVNISVQAKSLYGSEDLVLHVKRPATTACLQTLGDGATVLLGWDIETALSKGNFASITSNPQDLNCLLSAYVWMPAKQAHLRCESRISPNCFCVCPPGMFGPKGKQAQLKTWV